MTATGVLVQSNLSLGLKGVVLLNEALSATSAASNEVVGHNEPPAMLTQPSIHLQHSNHTSIINDDKLYINGLGLRARASHTHKHGLHEHVLYTCLQTWIEHVYILHEYNSFNTQTCTKVQMYTSHVQYIHKDMHVHMYPLCVHLYHVYLYLYMSMYMCPCTSATSACVQVLYTLYIEHWVHTNCYDHTHVTVCTAP